MRQAPLTVEVLLRPTYDEGRALGLTDRGIAYIRSRRITSLSTGIALARLRGFVTLTDAIRAGHFEIIRLPVEGRRSGTRRHRKAP